MLNVLNFSVDCDGLAHFDMKQTQHILHVNFNSACCLCSQNDTHLFSVVKLNGVEPDGARCLGEVLRLAVWDSVYLYMSTEGHSAYTHM